jgi:AAA+ ATPase superfamily predicted ATPase
MGPPKDEFRHIPNPYIVGNPIENRDMFFGREDDFEFIHKRVVAEKKGGLLVLCGARRSGKTSILFQIKGGRLGEGFLPILIDMQSMTVQDDSEFLAKLAQEIIRSIDHAEISYKSDYLAAAADNPFGAFEALIKVINLKMSNRKIVLMFDEYELIETHLAKGRFSQDILHLLANWMEHQGGVFIIFTGSDKLETRNKDVWANFLGKALHRRISFLSRADTFRLIHNPVQDVVRYAKGLDDFLYHLTAGQPFYSQVLCQALVDHLNEEKKYEIVEADVLQVLAEMIENPLPQMIFSWSSLTDVEKLCLSSLAELASGDGEPQSFAQICAYPQEQKTGWRFDEQKLHEAVERLFHYDLLCKTESGDNYFFKMDLWRQWVGRMHSIWQVVDEITEKGRKPDEGVRKDSQSGPARWLIPLGAALVLATFLGFYLQPKEPVINQQESHYVAAVIPDSGWVSVDASPAGAWVYVDDVRLGETPLPPLRLPVGKHFIDVEAAGYQSRRDSLTVVVGDTLDLDLALSESVGLLAVYSTPPGALITVDGKSDGRVTPATITDLAVRGRHTVQLELTGYLVDVRNRIEIQPNATESLRITLSPVTHDFTVRSTPDSAEVIFDGSLKGLTPLVIQEIRQGDHTLELMLDGYKPHVTRISVPVAGGPYTAQLELLPPATLQFMIRPYADIYIDGELKRSGASNYSEQLHQGRYLVRLDHPEFPSFEISVELASGTIDTLTHDMRD